MGNLRAWRQVATLLLLFAAADVLVPGLCVADSERAPATQSRSHGVAIGDIELDGQYDDCFCCCPHVIPELRQSVGSQQSTVDDVLHVLVGRTDLSPALLYHPPRAL